MRTLLDNDLYKFTMQQAVLNNFPNAEAEYKFVLRNKEVNLIPLLSKIKNEINRMDYQCFIPEDIEYLSNFPFFKKNYLSFLSKFKFNALKYVSVFEENNQLAIMVKGPWVETILFEVPLLAIVSEIYMQSCAPEGKYLQIFEEGRSRLDEKIKYLKNLENPFKLIDFGTRRRFSTQWHDFVVSRLTESLGKDILVGTSNVDLALKYKLQPVGTHAHEFISAGQGISETSLLNSQKFMLETWLQEYRGQLGIALTDTLNMDSFLEDFDLYLAKGYDGCRHDSGDPFIWGDKLIAHYQKLGIDTLSKVAVFSDNLDFKKANDLNLYFKDKIKPVFGIGTFLTNDLGIKPLSIVLKLIRLNSCSIAKISDEPEKAISGNDLHLTYLTDIFANRLRKGNL